MRDALDAAMRAGIEFRDVKPVPCDRGAKAMIEARWRWKAVFRPVWLDLEVDTLKVHFEAPDDDLVLYMGRFLADVFEAVMRGRMCVNRSVELAYFLDAARAEVQAFMARKEGA